MRFPLTTKTVSFSVLKPRGSIITFRNFIYFLRETYLKEVNFKVFFFRNRLFLKWLVRKKKGGKNI